MINVSDRGIAVSDGDDLFCRTVFRIQVRQAEPGSVRSIFYPVKGNDGLAVLQRQNIKF